MEITEITDQELKQFIKKNNHNITHTPEFRDFISNTFKKSTPHYLKLNSTVLPLFLTRHPFLGKKLISVSFNDFGGLSGTLTKQILNNFSEYLKSNFKADSLEIRDPNQLNFKHYSDFHKDESYALYTLKLTSEEKVWNAMDRKRRNSIRRGQEQKIEIRDIKYSEIPLAYKLYLKNMKAFGTPPFSKRFFENFGNIIIKNNLGKSLGAYVNNKLVCCLMAYTYNKRVDSIIGVSDPDYKSYNLNDVAYWEFIRWAIKNKYQTFSFGRSLRESSHAKFKLKWGCKEEPLGYFSLSLNNKPIEHFNTNSPKYRLLINIWKKLPLFLTRWFGPWIREGLGI